MSSISFQCLSCGHSITVPEDKAGKSGQCPNCEGRVKVPQPIGGNLTGRQHDTKTAHDELKADAEPIGLKPRSRSERLARKRERPVQPEQEMPPPVETIPLTENPAAVADGKSVEDSAQSELQETFKVGGVQVVILPPSVIHEEFNTYPGSVQRLREFVTDYLRFAPEITRQKGTLELKFLNYSVYFSPEISNTKIGIDVHGRLDGKKVSTIVRYEQEINAAFARSVMKHLSPLDYQRLKVHEAYKWQQESGQKRQAKMLRSRMNLAIDTATCEIVTNLDKAVERKSPLKSRWILTQLACLGLVAVLVSICGQIRGTDALNSSTSNILVAAMFVGIPAAFGTFLLGSLTMPDRFFRQEPAGLRLRRFVRVHSVPATRLAVGALGALATIVMCGGWWFVQVGSK